MRLINLGWMSAAALSLAACGAETDTEAVDTETPELNAETLDPSAKSDGAQNVFVERVRGGYLATLQGSTAKAVFDVMDDANIFRNYTRRGVEYHVGRYLVCAAAGEQAACRLFSQEIAEEEGTLSVDGRRFRSAASELFGALAAIEGVDARRVSEVAAGDVSCTKNARTAWCEVGMAAEPNVSVLSLSLSNLGDLGPDYVYEGWLITSEGPVTSGRFPMNDAMESFEFELDRDLLADSAMFVLTIEPAFNDDPAPADTHVVAGAFDADGLADLTIAHPAALGSDFTDATGSYFLETPTSADVADDYDQGIWFIRPGEGAGLSLPELPAGWVYEGWVVDENGPETTGRFIDPAGPDSDMGGKAAGPDAAPPFPGQDFIDPARTVVGNTIVITIEPEPDNSPAPFFFKPLVDMSAEDLGPGAVLQDMTNQAEGTAPAGTAALLF
ncbi:MAG: hypothetical protein ACE366_04725 [Bradymonadia bacterium]